MVYDFGLRLKWARKRKNLMQKQVAERLGLNSRTIMAYESNSVFPSLDVFKKLSMLYDVSTDYLLGLEHTKIPQQALDEIESRLAAMAEEINRINSRFQELKKSEDA